MARPWADNTMRQAEVWSRGEGPLPAAFFGCSPLKAVRRWLATVDALRTAADEKWAEAARYHENLTHDLRCVIEERDSGEARDDAWRRRWEEVIASHERAAQHFRARRCQGPQETHEGERPVTLADLPKDPDGRWIPPDGDARWQHPLWGPIWAAVETLERISNWDQASASSIAAQRLERAMESMAANLARLERLVQPPKDPEPS